MTAFRIPPHLKGDREVEAKLREVAAAIRANPLLAYNNPELLAPGKVHSKQLLFNAVKAPVMGTKAMIAGNRTGKTYCCCADDVIQLIPEPDVPPHLKGYKKFEAPIDIWIGAPKYTKHEDTIIPILRRLIPKHQLIGGNFDRSYKAQSRLIKLNCGSTIGLKTYDQDLDAWASAAIHRIHWDEEPNNANGLLMRSEARARLISTGGDEILGMTPMLGISTWAFTDVWERRFDPDITVMGMSMEDNPWNTQEAIDKFLAGLTEEEREARRHGRFVHFGGLFFDEFREELHTVDPPPIERIRKLEHVVTIDPGLVHTGVTWQAFDSDNAAIVFSEFFPPKTVVPDIAAEIHRRNKEFGIGEPTYVIDPSYRNLQSDIYADQVQSAYAREGIYAQEGQNDRRAGILEVKRRLQAKDGQGRLRPVLLISKACPQLILQMERYRRDPTAKDEWQAVPQDDRTRFDLVDSMRYGLMSRAWHLPEEVAPKPPSYQHDYQPPLEEERAMFQSDPPPFGDAS